MSTSADIRSPPTANAPVPQNHNVPALLTREPSQQDLDMARQLQSFSSQGQTRHEQTRSELNGGPPAAQEPLQHHGRDENQAHHDLRDIAQSTGPAQAQTQASNTPAPIQFTPLHHNQAPSPNGASPSNVGQMCRSVQSPEIPIPEFY